MTALDTATEVTLVRVDLLAPPATVAAYERTLAADERARADRFRHSEDRRRFVVRRGVLREVLGSRTGTAPRDVVVRRTALGQPYLDMRDMGEMRDPNEAPIRFSVSQSGDVALIAVTNGVRVGVDVERVDRTADVDALARDCCSPRERSELAALPVATRRRAFFEMWTRKEAVAKLLGVGLGLPPDRIDVTASGLPSNPGAGCLTLEPLAVPGAAATLALEAPAARIVERTWGRRDDARASLAG